SEQFGDVRRTNCALVLAAEHDVADRRQLGAREVGPHAADVAQRVFRVTEAAVELETVDEGLLDERNAKLAISFLRVILAVSRRASVEADHVAAGEEGVRIEGAFHPAIIQAEREANRRLSPGAREEMAGHASV